jgi:hypothetical protein
MLECSWYFFEQFFFSWSNLRKHHQNQHNCRPLYYYTLRYATLRYATIRFATIRYATIRYATLCYVMLLYATIRYYTLRYATIPALAVSIFNKIFIKKYRKPVMHRCNARYQISVTYLLAFIYKAKLQNSCRGRGLCVVGHVVTKNKAQPFPSAIMHPTHAFRVPF